MNKLTQEIRDYVKHEIGTTVIESWSVVEPSPWGEHTTYRLRVSHDGKRGRAVPYQYPDLWWTRRYHAIRDAERVEQGASQ